MDDKINKAVDQAIANLNVDDLKVTKDQIDEIKRRLSNDKEFIKNMNEKNNEKIKGAKK